MGGCGHEDRCRPDPRVTSSPWRPSLRSPRSPPVTATSARRGRTSSRASRCGRSGGGCSGSRRSRCSTRSGLALGLYIALVLRSVVFGDPVLWSLLWRTESEEWLPFLDPDHPARLLAGGAVRHAGAPRRSRAGRVVAAARRRDRPRVRVRDRLRLQHDRADPDRAASCARSRSACCAPPTTRSRSSCSGCSTPASGRSSSAAGESLATLQRMLSGKRAGIAYEFVDVLPPERDRELSERIALTRPDEVILQRGRLRRGCRARDRRDGASRRREGADRAEDDRLAAPARRVRPRPGNAALRAAAACVRRHGLGGEEGVRPRRQLRRRPASGCRSGC